MNVYQYIANNNPDAAFEVCKGYGYHDINNLDDLSHCLEICVANNGKEAFEKIMELHPDKDALVELFSVNNINQQPLQEVLLKEAIMPMPPSVKNADGETSLVNKTNLYILGGAALIAFTILLSKK